MLLSGSAKQLMIVEMPLSARSDSTCWVAACAEILGAKWTAVLVHDLSDGKLKES